MKQDLCQAPDYFMMDELLSEEHLLIRNAARDWLKEKFHLLLKKLVKKQSFKKIITGLGRWGLWTAIPQQYGGSGLDEISYGLIMQELERGDSEWSTASVQSSLVAFIWKYGSENKKINFYQNF